jgi:hypothetical protein
VNDDEQLKRRVFAFDVQLHFEVYANGPRDAEAQREWLRSRMETVASYAQRKAGMEIAILDMSEPEFVRRDP